MTRLEILEARYFGNGPELSEKEMAELRVLVAERDNPKPAKRSIEELAEAHRVAMNRARQPAFRVTSGPTPWRNPTMFFGRR